MSYFLLVSSLVLKIKETEYIIKNSAYHVRYDDLLFI